MKRFSGVDIRMPRQLARGALVLALMLTGQGVARADLCEKTPALNLNAVSSEEIDNDTVRLNWQVQLQASTANEAMRAVSQVLNKSIQSMKANPGVSKLRNNIQTYPQYGKDRSIQSWQGVGTLTFEMPVSVLQEQKALVLEPGLTLSNLEYFPSDAALDKVRTRLLDRAIKEFQAKAAFAANGFGAKGYSVGEININDEGHHGGGPIYPRMAAASVEMMSKAMDVPMAAGVSKVSVSVNGRVCLKP